MDEEACISHTVTMLLSEPTGDTPDHGVVAISLERMAAEPPVGGQIAISGEKRGELEV